MHLFLLRGGDFYGYKRVLEIWVKEWNQCNNVKNDKDGRKCEWESIKK